MLHHYELEHKNLILRCPTFGCDESFLNDKNLRRHLIDAHITGAPVQCEFCAKLFVGKSQVEFHIEQKHPEKVSESPRFFCQEPGCGLGFVRLRVLRKHCRGEHAHPKPKATTRPPAKATVASECPICHGLFRRVGLHITLAHEESCNSFMCRFCQKVFQSPEVMIQHRVREHHKAKVKEPVACDVCGKVLASKRLLYCHKRAVHDRVRHECTQCDKTYTRLSDMRCHVRSVHEGLKLSCRFCPILFLRGSQRNQHERKAHGEELERSNV